MSTDTFIDARDARHIFKLVLQEGKPHHPCYFLMTHRPIAAGAAMPSSSSLILQGHLPEDADGIETVQVSVVDNTNPCKIKT